MMRFTSCFMPPGGAADIVDDGGADLYRVLAQKMPAAMLRPPAARSLWPSLSYTAGAPTATVSWLRWPSTQVSVRGADRAALCGRRAGRKDFLKSHTRYRTGGDGRHVGVAGIHNGADPGLIRRRHQPALAPLRLDRDSVASQSPAYSADLNVHNPRIRPIAFRPRGIKHHVKRIIPH